MVTKEIEEAFEKERKEAKVEERKEKYEKLMKGLGKIEEYVTRKRKPIYKAKTVKGKEVVVRERPRGITRPGEAYKFGRQVSPHLMAALTGTKVQKTKKGDKGRGRPRETYKVRVLPSGKVVKVPTAVYKKMLSAEKAQMRLVRAQRQMEAEQLAMQQDMRYQPSAEEQFLAEPDQLHEMEVMKARQMAEMEAMEPEIPSRPTVGRRIVRRVGDFARGVSRVGRPRPQMVDEYKIPIQQQLFRPPARGREIRREPRVTAVSGKVSLFKAPNNVNNNYNPEQSMLTEHKEINFFSNKQPIRRPDRSKSFKIMRSQDNR